MNRVYAIIENGFVVNLILATSWHTGIDVTDLDPRPSIGWAYDGETFVAPEEIPEPPLPEPITETPLMTHYAFLNRFTFEELVAIEMATDGDITLRVARLKFDKSKEIDVSLAEVQNYVGYMAMLTLISGERIPTILAPIGISEKGAIHPVTFEVTP